MKEINKYYVCGIDDCPDKDFADTAPKSNILIDNVTNLQDACELLESKKNYYDAIILQAKCKLTPSANESSLKALSTAINTLTMKYPRMPWFVYTGSYEDIENIKLIVPQNPTTGKETYIYNKSHDRDLLLHDIKSVLDSNADRNIRIKYKDVFSWYDNSDLLDVLKNIEANNNTYSDGFNKIRKILESICDLIIQKGFLPIEFRGNLANKYKTYLTKNEYRKYIPLYVQRSIYSVTDIANNGSHACINQDLTVDIDVKNGKAPYLMRSTAMELLNILIWLKRVNLTDADKNDLRRIFSRLLDSRDKQQSVPPSAPEKRIVQRRHNKDDLEGREGIVLNAGNCYYSFNCVLPPIAQNYINKRVKLYDIQDNMDERTNTRYPFTANFELVR